MKLSLVISIIFISLTSYAQSNKTLVVIGDSLTEGYGLSKDSAFPKLLENSLKDWKVVNAGISGSTSASALSRVKWTLKSKPKVILIALGANDGLRGLSVKELKKNLAAAIDEIKKTNTKVLLAGMQAPPNYGKKYTQDFSAVYPSLSKEKNVPLYPFLLDGVAGNAKLNLTDGIHPNEEGHKIILEKILPFIKKELP